MTSKKTKHVSKATDSSSNGLDEAKALLKTISALVGSPPALTATDRKRSSKLRKGGEAVIPAVAALANQFGLAVPGLPTATMLAQLNKAQSLVPLHKQMVTALKKVEDSIFLAHSESWSSTTVHYTMLQRLAKKDGDLAKALAPVSQFFAARSRPVEQAEEAKRGHRKGVKEPKAPKQPTDASERPRKRGRFRRRLRLRCPRRAPRRPRRPQRRRSTQRTPDSRSGAC